VLGIEDLQRHLTHQRARHAEGVPTITVVLGEPAAATACLQAALARCGYSAVVCGQDDEATLLDAWLDCLARDRDLTALALDVLARETHTSLPETRARWSARSAHEQALHLARLAAGPSARAHRAAAWLALYAARDRRGPSTGLDAALALGAWVPRTLLPVLCIARADGLALRVLSSLCTRLPFMPIAAVLPRGAFEAAARALGPRVETLLREGVFALSERPRASHAEPREPAPHAGSSADDVAHSRGQQGPAPSLHEATDAANAVRGHARSKPELRLYELLEADAETRGKFRLNQRMAFKFGSGAAEIDLMCEAHRIAVEVDGFHHFADREAYRRDRRKDVLLQTRDIWVSRHLADDVLERGDQVVRIIKELIAVRFSISRGEGP